MKSRQKIKAFKLVGVYTTAEARSTMANQQYISFQDFRVLDK